MSSIVAIPTEHGRACAHFGHCEAFTLVTVVAEEIHDERVVTPPAHQPGLYPRFLAEQGVTLVLAGGMGQKARALFQQQGIQVVVGVAPKPPRELVKAFLAGDLEASDNQCDHGGHAHGGGHGCGA